MTVTVSNGSTVRVSVATNASLVAVAAADATAKAAAAQAAAVQRANHTGSQLLATISDFAGASISSARLVELTLAEAWQMAVTAVYSDGVVQTANVVWPDGSAGVFTTTTHNTTHGMIDAYTVTHVASGRTVTQPAVTRDAAGNITTSPALTVG